ncbi:MAG: hypothetical protein MZU95_09815 [Desulfomicrobium escambiense]|nr:hypothetical protein [Desulfomicrobium escambiense]
MVGKIGQALGELKGLTLAVLGLSFKPNTDDIRRGAGSVHHRATHQRKGHSIRAYDPVAMENTKRGPPGYNVLCRCGCLMTPARRPMPWSSSRNGTSSATSTRTGSASLPRQPCFFDLRNIYEPERMRARGFRYVAVGRG